MEKLMRQEIDAAFIRPGLEDPRDVHLKRLADEPMLIALPAHHPLAKLKTVPLSALSGEPFILFPRTVGLSLYDDIVRGCRDAGFELVVTQEAPQIPSVINLVAADLGVSIVPGSLAHLKLDGVAYRPIEGPPLVARLGLAMLKARRSRVVGNLMSLI
ncbi:LysR substrate-binding domain-containing protein, partial [Rhizobium sp.]|uniref:LysR substrate-binding domain-containing protein n=1 Tax=Rhizobium sp. TaxID=391 RepID=UPI0028A73544